MIRNLYQKHGIQHYYQSYGDSYINPHDIIIHNFLEKQNSLFCDNSILDFGAGHGLVTSWLQRNNFSDIVGLEPFLFQRYHENTGCHCIECSFEDIAIHGLSSKFDTIIASFSLHLCPISFLEILLYQLAISSKQLIIISPHKKPFISDVFWKQTVIDYQDKVYFKVYKSLF